jgi:hypothetical protein
MFVGSSTEAKGLIRGLSLNLNGDVTVDNWSAIAWPLSKSTLDGIEQALNRADFAAFILSNDDATTIRGETLLVPRDNVLFELGMSLGRLGVERTFILAPKVGKSDQRRPPDLFGITVIPYEIERDHRTTMANPASRIMEAIEEVGPKSRGGNDGALKRGDTAHIDVVADGALSVRESRNTNLNELRQAVLKGEKVPAKFQFAEADGGRHWLSLCRSDKYHYFEKAKALLRSNAAKLADNVSDTVGSTAVDLVSLGSGDGSKDDIILHELVAGLDHHDYVYYYPVDISDILLVEAVRYVAKHGLAWKRFRCKPVLGDFTDLRSLDQIVAHRPSPNLFSVLGNVLGSFDESDILASIAGAMQVGDLVLIEANIGDPDDSVALLEDDAASQWDLSTLDALDIPRQSCDLEQNCRGDLSVVPGTKTLVSYAVPREDGQSKYMLSAMHHYDLGELRETIRKKLDVVLIAEFLGDGVCLLLGQRRS